MLKKIVKMLRLIKKCAYVIYEWIPRNHALLDKIKVEAAQEIINAEIAQRTKDTPRGLQYENMAPYEYFTRLVGKFETQMVHYRRQIEETEQHLISMARCVFTSFCTLEIHLLTLFLPAVVT